MRLSRVAIILLLLASLIAMGYAQQSNYAGAAKLVLEITKLNTCPYSSYSSQYYSPYYTVKVLYSSDQNLTVGQDYTMQIMLVHTKDFGAQVLTPQPLVQGTVVGINDYWFDTSDNQINVGITGDSVDDWTQGVILLSSGNTDSTDDQRLNPVSSASSSSNIFSAIPSMGIGNNGLDLLPTGFLTGNMVLQTPSIPSSSYVPFDLFSSGLSDFPSLVSKSQIFSPMESDTLPGEM